jgi:hypothetical protein
LATTHAIGPHRITIDGDWVELQFIGPVGLDASTPMHAHLAEVLANNNGRAYVLADITRLEGLPPDTRRQMSAWNREHKVTAAAVFGGSFTMRTIVTLALKAIKFRDREQVDAMFARDEQQARSWLLNERAKRER